MSDILQSAQSLIDRASSVGEFGHLVSSAELQGLPVALLRHVPVWYVDLLLTVPLAGLRFDYGRPCEGDDVPPWRLIWSGVGDMASESLEAYPGLAVLDRGFINVAMDASGGGNPFFIKDDASHDPAVWQIYHDVSDDADEILKHGLVEVAPRLSVLLTNARVD